MGPRIAKESEAMRLLRLCTLGGLLVAIHAASAVCCPFCMGGIQPTMSETLAQASSVCLVEKIEGRAPGEEDPGSTTLAVLQVVKSAKTPAKGGDRITLARFWAGKKGDLFLLMGVTSGSDNSVAWGNPTEITRT